MFNRLTCFFFILFFAKGSVAQKSLTLVDQKISLANGLSFKLKIPVGYKITVAWQGLNRPRFFSKSPDGRLFVTDMYDKTDNSKGKVIILDNWIDSVKKFSNAITYLDNLHNPNQVEFYSKAGLDFIYVSETQQLTYYPYFLGDNKPSVPSTVIAKFPDYGLSYKYGGWHLTRSLTFHNNKLYVSIGSSCDACIEKEEIRASIITMDPEGGHQKFFARGLRNAVGLVFVKDQLWVSNMGRDNRGPDKPEETVLPVKEGTFYGWPYYFQYRKQIVTDENFKDSTRPAFVKKPPIASWGIKAHSAPLGLTYVENCKDSSLQNTFLVALHGSTSVWRQRGNAIVQLMPNGNYREIVTGFLQGTTEDKRYGRPCDIFQWDNHSFFISDDKNGVIYYLYREK